MGIVESPDFDQMGTLAHRAQGGDGAAYEELLGQLYTHVRMVLVARLGYASELDDLTQTCVLAMHKSLPTYHPSRRFRPWVQAIIRYKLADHFRAQARRREFAQTEEVLELENQTNLGNEGSNLSDEVNVYALLTQLPPDWAQAVRLTKLEGLSCDEAARQSGVSTAALRKRVSRAYRKLADLIEKELES